MDGRCFFLTFQYVHFDEKALRFMMGQATSGSNHCPNLIGPDGCWWKATPVGMVPLSAEESIGMFVETGPPNWSMDKAVRWLRASRLNEEGYDLRTWEDILKGQQRDPILDIRKCLDKCHFDINKGKLIENVLINMAFDLEFPIAAGIALSSVRGST